MVKDKSKTLPLEIKSYSILLAEAPQSTLLNELTVFAVAAAEPLDTQTPVRVHSISAGSSVLTRIW